MRKKSYLKLKKRRKQLRRRQRKTHDKLWSNFKGLTKDKDTSKICSEFICICDKTEKVTNKLKSMGYYDNDLKIKRAGVLQIKKRAC